MEKRETISRRDVLAGEFPDRKNWSCDKCGQDTGMEAGNVIPAWVICDQCYKNEQNEKE